MIDIPDSPDEFFYTQIMVSLELLYGHSSVMLVLLSVFLIGGVNLQPTMQTMISARQIFP